MKAEKFCITVDKGFVIACEKMCYFTFGLPMKDKIIWFPAIGYCYR